MRQIADLETTVYVTLIDIDRQALQLADRAESLALPHVAIRARLLASDVLSRRGDVSEAERLQLALHAESVAAGFGDLAARACLYLASTAERLGKRKACLSWAGAAQLPAAGAPPGWRAEALMVLGLFTVSHVGFDQALLEHALDEVRAVGNPVLTTVTLANLAEVATECDDLPLGRQLVAEGLELLVQSPSASSALTWESFARVQLACGDLDAADRSIDTALRLGARLGLCDVNGEPYLTLAELRLAQGDAEGAQAALVDPDRVTQSKLSPWVATRELVVRAKIFASLGRWQEAYECMVEFSAAYEKVRSVEAERTAVESGSAQTAKEERLRASKFEQLALRDSLTGLPNRRYADERLATFAKRFPTHDGDPVLLSVAILDVDRFKRINDTYSHDVGDRVLTRLGEFLHNVIDTRAPIDGELNAATDEPGQGFVARLGGEEFVLVMPDISHTQAAAACERLLAELRRTSFEDIASGLTVRASIGLVTLATPADRAAMLRTADACLFEAKRGGRDRLVATQHALDVPRRGPGLPTVLDLPGDSGTCARATPSGQRPS